MTAAEAVLLRSARLGGTGELVDVLLADGLVRAVGPDLPADPGTETVDLDGRTVLPGLWDHHVHFDQWVLARERLDLSAATSAAHVVALVAERLGTRPPAPGTPLVGYGFRDALWTDVPHRDLLDAVSGDAPVVLASGDLHCCWVNSAAAKIYDQGDHPTGILRETEWQPVAEAIRDVPTDVMDRLCAETTAAAASRGVVGVVELESPWHLDTWVRRAQQGCRDLRVSVGVWPPKLDAAIDRGLRTGDVVPDTGGLVEMGPLKVIIDGSLNTRTAYCADPYPGLTDSEHSHGMLLVPQDELVALMSQATSHGLRCAIHAIGDLANSQVLDAFERTGARGSIEHAQLVAPADVPRFAELGVVASVQPEHALDDRDVADEIWKGRAEHAFPYGALHAAGATLALGSDAPVAPLDPWVSIAAAVHRSRDERPRWYPEHEVGFEVALAASTRSGRTTLAAGDPGDVAIVDEDPYAATPAGLRTMPVAGTLLAGQWTWRDGV